MNTTIAAGSQVRGGRSGLRITKTSTSADRWEQFGTTLEQAHALLGQGRCLVLAGDPDADAPLRRARALFHEMGARPRVTECDALIAQAARLTS